MKRFVIFLFLFSILTAEAQQTELAPKKQLSFELHGGAFGLFNVNNVFTKADYTLGLTSSFDIALRPRLTAGLGISCMGGQARTTDPLRMMLNADLRLRYYFFMSERITGDLLLAGGFSDWPSSPGTPVLTPTFLRHRMGWDIRTMAGAAFRLNEKLQLRLAFGYWASSSSSDNIVWITHDSMLISFGPQFNL